MTQAAQMTNMPAQIVEPRADPVRTNSLLRWALVIPEFLCATLLALLILFMVAAVFSRYVFNIGLTWSDELSRLLFAWVVLLGFAIAVRHRTNVAVDWLVMMLPRRQRHAMGLLQDAVGLAFSVLFTWEAWVTVRFSLIQRMPALDITIAWMYGSALVGGVLMVIYGIANLVETLNGRVPKSHIELSSEVAHVE
jgi:TRAP-type transport system small permease protein